MGDPELWVLAGGWLEENPQRGLLGEESSESLGQDPGGPKENLPRTEVLNQGACQV